MTAASYYSRENVVHIDGTRVFQNAEDRAGEDTVAAVLARAWNCEVRHFGALSPVDWYAVRAERVVAIMELKSRSHDLAKYSSVFLNVRKWLALTMASVGMGVPAIFVVRFTDALTFAPLSDIDPRAVRIAGCARRVKSDSRYRAGD
jgi:hypothetical protein